MFWYSYVAWFFAGAFLVNSVPHVVQGISGNKFQTPFATPRGVGEFLRHRQCNLGLCQSGDRQRACAPHLARAIAAVAALPHGACRCALALALHLARHFSSVRSGPPHP